MARATALATAVAVASAVASAEANAERPLQMYADAEATAATPITQAGMEFRGGWGGQQHKPCKAEAMCALGNSRQTTTCQCLLCSSNLPASAATLTDSDVAAAESDTLHLAMLSRASPAPQVWLGQVFVLHA